MTTRAGESLRSATGAGFLLIGRRALRDSSLIVAWILTVAFAMLLAIVGPAHIVSTLDSGAREAVQSSGSASDLVVQAPVEASNEQLQLPTLNPAEVEAEALAVVNGLPSALGATISSSTVTVTGPPLLVASFDLQPALDSAETQLRLRPTMLTEQNLGAVELVNGTLPIEPKEAGSPVPILISSASVQASSLGIGSVIRLPVIDADFRGSASLMAEVVGVVREKVVEPDGLSPWRDVGDVWTPGNLSDGGTVFVSIAILMSPESMDRLLRSQGGSFTAVIRNSFDPAAFTSSRLGDAVAETERLVANSPGLTAASGAVLSVSSGLAGAVIDYPDRARAALAELSIIVAGVVGAAGAVLVLVSRLIVARRLPDLLLQRARGSSLVAIFLRNFAEAVVVVVVSLVMSCVAARAAGVDLSGDAAPLAIVAGVSLFAGVSQILFVLGARSRTAMIGVNRSAGLARTRQLRSARLAAEFALVVLACGSAFALLDRGLLQTASSGIDPLVAGSPLLIALAMTAIMLRVARRVGRAMGVARTSSRGILGPVMASRLPRGVAVVPLAALTISIALAVSTGVIAFTVRSGQVGAAWQAVGADARIDGVVTEDDIARVAAEKGVVAAAGFTTDSAQLSLGTAGTRVTLVAVAPGFARLIAQLPDLEGVMDGADAAALSLLELDARNDMPVPVVVDGTIADRLRSDRVTMKIGAETVELSVVGTVRSRSDSLAEESRIYVDLATLAGRIPSALTADSLLALGPGAVDAVEQLDRGGAELVTRAGWLEDWREDALVAGVERAMVVAVGTLAVLALIAIVCATLAGSRERARYLALLRTLGVHARFGIYLSAIDQLPLMMASLIGGLLAGIGTAVLLAPALGLELLSGGRTSPEVVIPPLSVLQVAAGAVLVFAIGILIEALLRRRDRVSDTIRVGETL